jgi:tight adherence protein B
MIVRAVRVGVPVTQSIRAVGREIAAPTGPEFTKLADELAIGVTLEDALKTMAERNGLREYRFFATALTLQTQTGGGLSETLENLADVIRKRVALRQKGQALAAEAKTSAGVLAALPLVAGVGLWVLNSEYIDPLFTESGGHKILAVAAGALGGGILTMRSMIRRSLS